MRRVKKGPPGCRVRALGHKSDSVLEERRRLREALPVTGFYVCSENAGPCWVGPAGLAQKPLCSPPAPDNGTERNYLFSKRLSRRPSPGWLISMRLRGDPSLGPPILVPSPAPGPSGPLGGGGNSQGGGGDRSGQGAAQHRGTLGAALAIGCHCPKLHMRKWRQAGSCPGPLRKACSGIASLGRTGPPCFGKGMISVGGGSGRPDWHQGVSVCLGINPRWAGGI